MTLGDLLSPQVTHDRRSRSWWTWLGSEYNLLFSHHSIHPTLYRKRKPLPLSLNTLILSFPSLSTFVIPTRVFLYSLHLIYIQLTFVRDEVSYGNLGSHFKSNSLNGAVPILAIQWRRLWQGRWRKDLE